MASLPLVSLLLTASFAPHYAQRLDDASGRLQLGLGVLSEPLPGDLRWSARAYALARGAELGLPASSNLSLVDVFGTRFGASFHLSQQVAGIDVWEARVVVTVDPQRRVRSVSSSLVSYERAVLEWPVTPTRAMQIAAERVPWPVLQPGGEPYGGYRRQLFLVGSELHAGYLIFIPTLNPGENWHFAVSAVTGDLLWQQNRVFHAREADVYGFSPGGLDAGVGVSPVTRVDLTHSDGGAMVLSDVTLALPDGGTLQFANDAGLLFGTQLVGLGCCPAMDCSTSLDAGPRQATGTTSFMGLNVTYDMAVCDRAQRAGNDNSINPSGDYVFTPVDGPTGPVQQASAPDSDPFAEVQAFYHVNKVYDWFKELSTAAAPLYPGQNIGAFQLRDEKRTPRRTLTVWTNVTMPDFNDINVIDVLVNNTAKTYKLARVDNAAFMPRENFQQLLIPELALDTDALLLFQGTQADFAYDAPVVWHEFGHAVINSTAAFSAFHIDSRSGNSEGAALHEGLADYFAAAYGQKSIIGEYVGPRMTVGNSGQLPQVSGLRDADNTFACPEVLWGEPHQDGQHVTGALWQARKEHFLGTDNGRTFDAVIYAALVAMAPNTHFEGAAAIIKSKVQAAFPSVAEAETKLQAIFDSRGITQCSKIVDMTGVTTKRSYYGIGGRQQAGVAVGVVPGPYQFKLKVPSGTKSVSFSASFQSGLGGSAPEVALLAKVGSPITFSRAFTSVSHDADVVAAGVVSGSQVGTQATLKAPCGPTSEVYLTLATGATEGQTLRDVSVAFEPADTCVADAGTDAGDSGDAGAVSVVAISDGGVITGSPPAGCGCASLEAGFPLLALLGLAGAGLRRRTRR